MRNPKLAHIIVIFFKSIKRQQVYKNFRAILLKKHLKNKTKELQYTIIKLKTQTMNQLPNRNTLATYYNILLALQCARRLLKLFKRFPQKCLIKTQ